MAHQRPDVGSNLSAILDDLLATISQLIVELGEPAFRILVARHFRANTLIRVGHQLAKSCVGLLWGCQAGGGPGTP